MQAAMTVLTVTLCSLMAAHVMAQPAGAGMVQAIEQLPMQPLSDGERAGLLLMIEEEKLAHDVYAGLYDRWGLRPFHNIGWRSEIMHMSAVRVLLQRYGLADPTAGMPPGRYASKQLQSIYNDLVTKGSSSLGDALSVGAHIEELDIADLQRLIAQSDNDDIRIVYQNLAKGSRNHLRTFMWQLRRRGLDYAPQHMSPEQFNAVLATEHEKGFIADPEFKLR